MGTAWKVKYHAQCQLTRNCRCFEIPRGNGRIEWKAGRLFEVSNQTDQKLSVTSRTERDIIAEFQIEHIEADLENR